MNPEGNRRSRTEFLSLAVALSLFLVGFVVYVPAAYSLEGELEMSRVCDFDRSDGIPAMGKVSRYNSHTNTDETERLTYTDQGESGHMAECNIVSGGFIGTNCINYGFVPAARKRVCQMTYFAPPDLREFIYYPSRYNPSQEAGPLTMTMSVLIKFTSNPMYLVLLLNGYIYQSTPINIDYTTEGNKITFFDTEENMLLSERIWTLVERLDPDDTIQSISVRVPPDGSFEDYNLHGNGNALALSDFSAVMSEEDSKFYDLIGDMVFRNDNTYLRLCPFLEEREETLARDGRWSYTDASGNVIFPFCPMNDGNNTYIPDFTLRPNIWYKFVSEVTHKPDGSFKATFSIYNAANESSPLFSVVNEDLSGTFGCFHLYGMCSNVKIDNLITSLAPENAVTSQDVEVRPAQHHVEYQVVVPLEKNQFKEAKTSSDPSYLSVSDQVVQFWEDLAFKPSGDVFNGMPFALPYAVKVEVDPEGFESEPMLCEERLMGYDKVITDGIIKNTIDYRWTIETERVGEDRYDDGYLTVDMVMKEAAFRDVPGPEPAGYPPKVPRLFLRPGSFQTSLDFKYRWVHGNSQGYFTFTDYDFDSSGHQLKATPLTVQLLDRTAPWVIAFGSQAEEIAISKSSDPEPTVVSLKTFKDYVPPSLGGYAGSEFLEDAKARQVIPLITQDQQGALSDALLIDSPGDDQQALLDLIPWTGQKWRLRALVGDNFSDSGFAAWRYRKADADGNPEGEWLDLGNGGSWICSDIEIPLAVQQPVDEEPQGLQALVVLRNAQEAAIEYLTDAWNNLTGLFGVDSEDETASSVREAREITEIGIDVCENWLGFQYQLRVSDRQGPEGAQLPLENRFSLAVDEPVDEPDWQQVGNWVQTPPVFIRALDNDAPAVTALEISEEQSEVPVFRYPMSPPELNDFAKLAENKDALALFSKRLLAVRELLSSGHDKMLDGGAYGYFDPVEFREEMSILDSWQDQDSGLLVERSGGGPEDSPVTWRWSMEPADFSSPPPGSSEPGVTSIFTADYRLNRFPAGLFLSPLPVVDASGYPESQRQIAGLWGIPSAPSPSGSPLADWDVIRRNVQDIYKIPRPVHTLDSYLLRRRVEALQGKYPGLNDSDLYRRGHTFLLASPVQVTAGGRYLIKVHLRDNTVRPRVQLFYLPPVPAGAGKGYRLYEDNLWEIETEFSGLGDRIARYTATWYRSPSDVYTSDGVRETPVNFDEEGTLVPNMLPGLLIVEVFDEGTPDDPMDPEVYRRFLIPVYVRDRAVAHERVSVEERHTLEGVDEGGGTAPTGDDRFKWDW